MRIAGLITNYFYSYAIEKRKKNALLTVAWAIIFLSITGLFVVIPIYIGIILNIPLLWFPPFNLIFSCPFLVTGIILIIWTNMIFINFKGTPVPVYPPKELIVSGPFYYSRNPMTTGLFIIMFGIGIYYGCLLSLLIFTPLYIYLHTLELKFIEEPELEKRLGNNYSEYKKNTPRYFSIIHLKRKQV